MGPLHGLDILISRRPCCTRPAPQLVCSASLSCVSLCRFTTWRHATRDRGDCRSISLRRQEECKRTQLELQHNHHLYSKEPKILLALSTEMAFNIFLRHSLASAKCRFSSFNSVFSSASTLPHESRSLLSHPLDAAAATAIYRGTANDGRPFHFRKTLHGSRH